MKTKIFHIYFLLAFFSLAGFSQTISPKVYPTQGGFATAGNLQLSYTIGEPVNQTVKVNGYEFSFGFQQPQPNIVIGNIGASPFCAGSTIRVPFTATDILAANNVFTLQLSDASGDFFYPLIISTDTGRVSDTITAIIPFNLTGGTHYQLMIMASAVPGMEWASSPFSISSLGTPNNIRALSICSDTAYTFTFDSITAGSGGNQVEWSIDSLFDSLHFIAAGADVNIPVAAGHDSTIWVRTIDSLSGCFSKPEKIKVQVNKNPADTAHNTGPYCYQGTIILTATPANLRNYSWSGPDSTFSAITDSTTLVAAGNAGTYTVTVTDFNGCTASSSTTVSVNAPMAQPTVPLSQSACSDTALSFTFIDTIGADGNRLEWATNSLFYNSQFAASPDTITLTLGAGANRNIYIRSSDSTTGCTSVSVTINAAVYALPFPLTPAAAIDTICPHGSTNIVIPNAESGKSYTLKRGDSTIAIGYGNDFSLSLNTGSIDTTTTFTVTATDTLSGCSRLLQPAITIQTDTIIPAPTFTAGDTVIFADETIQYTAMNLSGSTMWYFIDTGDAVIDTATGWVSNANTSFVVKAVTAPVPGCHVADAHMPVLYYVAPAPPALPPSQTAWSDTAVTFVFRNIKPGRGSTQVQWSLDSAFASSTTFSDSGDITLTVDTNSSEKVYMRSRNDKGEHRRSAFSATVIAFANVIKLPPGVSTNLAPVSYVNLNTDASMTAAINTDNPVGVTPGSTGVSPSGAATYNIPITCPAGTNGMQPQISLAYNSQGGNGPMGYGWGISAGSTISRSGLDNFHDGKAGPITLNNATDAFNIDGTRLIVFAGTNGGSGAAYSKEAEDYSITFSQGTFGTGPDHFVVVTKDGMTMEYGNTPDSRFLTADRANILQWRLNKVQDPFGNYMLYKYDNSHQGCRLVEIDYTGNAAASLAPYTAVLFNYSSRFDLNTTYTAGTPATNQYLLTSIEITSPGTSNTFKNYVLSYGKDDLNSYLTAITEYGTDGTHLNATKFQYGSLPTPGNYLTKNDDLANKWSWMKSVRAGATGSNPFLNIGFSDYSKMQSQITGDFNGDGYSDILSLYQVYISPASTGYEGIWNETTPYNVAFMVSFMNPATGQLEKQGDELRSDVSPRVETFGICEYDASATDGVGLSQTITGHTMYADNLNIHANYEYFVGDYLGTGRDGILEVQRICNHGVLNIGTITYYTYDNSGNRTAHPFATPEYTQTYALAGYITTGDFDGDGMMDYILYPIDIDLTHRQSRPLISFPGKGIFNQPVSMPQTQDGLYSFIVPFSLPTYNRLGNGTHEPGYPDNIYSGPNYQSYIIDFDGDGKKDMLFITPGASYIFAFNKDSDGNYSFIETQKLAYPTINNNDQIFLGDFNGDGKTDILTHLKNGVSIPTGVIIPSNYYQNPGGNTALASNFSETSTDFTRDDVWNIGYSTGATFSQQAFLHNRFTAVPVIAGQIINFNTAIHGVMQSSDGSEITYNTLQDYLQAINCSQQLIVGDFNGDGKSDILYSAIPMAPSANNPFPGLAWDYTSCSYNDKLYYSQGSQFVSSPVNNMESGGDEIYTLGDFNGDGRTDIAHYPISPTSIGGNTHTCGNSNLFVDFYEYFFNPRGQERLLQNISDAFNQVKTFEYNPLTNPAVHTRGNTNAFPLISGQISLYVVNSLTVPDGIGGSIITTYNYTNALIHHAGLGFLGFEKVTSHNSASNTTNIANSVNYLSPYYKPEYVFQETFVGSQSIALTINNTEQKQLGSNHYFFYPASQAVYDRLSGTVSSTQYQYSDNYGNVTAVTNSNSVENSTIRTTYGQFGSLVPSKPIQISTTKSRGSVSAYTNSVVNRYDHSSGFLLIQLNTNGITTGYTPDGLGNVKGTTVLAGSFDSEKYKYVTYDNYGRFQVTSTNTLGQVSSFSNDINWGKPISVTGVDNNTTTFAYDGYGRVVNSVPPSVTHYSIPTAYNWAIDNDLHSIFTVATQPPGRPSVEVWNDAMGREVQRQTTGFGGNLLTSSTQYTNLNKPHHAIKPHYSTETPAEYFYCYDYLNRLIDTKDPFGNHTSVNYTYSGGNLTTKTIGEASGRWSSQTVDLSGKVISASDAGGTLTYKYDSYGNQIQVKNNSVVVSTAVYDPNTNFRLSLTNPNSGTYTYTYDGYGQVLTQADANGNTYTMEYDAAGNITQREGPEGTVTYTYVAPYNGGANKPSNISGTGSLTSQSFTYDNYGNLTSTTEAIKSHNYTTSSTYDNYNNIVTTTYPSGIEIGYDYDTHGYLTDIVRYTSGLTGHAIYTANAINSFGQATNYTLGNGLTSTLTANFGTPTHYYTSGIQDLSLDIDFTTGDLTCRKDAISGNKEHFTYDANDRLLSAKVNTNTAMEFTFESDGNIASKTDVGTYAYSSNAVIDVSNESGNVSNSAQNITYIGYNKASEITENAYDLKYTYGPDFNRRYSELDSATIPINTRTYLGSYEINDDQTGNPQQLHYIYGATGLIAIIVKDNSGVNEYYTYTDHLGSILTVTDNVGTVVAQQNFDAWGRNRNPADWSYTEATTPNFHSYNYRCPSGVPNWLYRGYTGHEMLPEFELINMNGRMYDPLLGRMLSPDNVVQLPYATQSYNKYTYGLNNPLKYNDPTGWQIGFNASSSGGNLFGINIGDYGGLTFGTGFLGTAYAWDGIYVTNPVYAPDLTNIDLEGVQTTSGEQLHVNAGDGPWRSALNGIENGAKGFFTHLSGQISNMTLQKAEAGILSNLFTLQTAGLSDIFVHGSDYIDNASSTWNAAESYIVDLPNKSSSTIAYDISYGVGYGGSALGTSFVVGTLTDGACNVMFANAGGVAVVIETDAVVTGANGAIPASGGVSGTYSVYQGFDEAGNIQYVGITMREPEIRFAEHLADEGSGKDLLRYRTIDGTGDLSKIDARIMEQQLINGYGLNNLLNQINSISPKYWLQYGITPP